ncbi:adenylate/guanylate cyclase domain-containing protein [Microvirga sp. WGZ8]|uniref:Adenylate/guanylate cyclase domain-containing protein n=1 Tax=Microvirga puerhi TaxID=2876078 RepID=A0ABS7VS71_9HYPH|nr:adenylate/guanylate cyclase domain-containing protein [Microvirga puerhi]
MDAGDTVADQLLYQAEIQAERMVAWLRLAVALLLASFLVASYAVLAISASIRTFRPPVPSLFIIGGFTLVSLVALLLIQAQRYRPAVGWAFAFLDVGFTIAAIIEGVLRNRLSGNDIFLLASVWAVPLVLAFNALRYRPAIVASTAVALALGSLAVASWAGVSLLALPSLSDYAHFADLPANAVRGSLLILIGFCLTLVVQRERQLLVRALAEQRELSILTRFLPPEVVPEPIRPGSRLRRGVSQRCTVLFIDLRNSTRLTEHMLPEQMADFLTRFRCRITRAVVEHGGLIEKFAGDGALIVFGVPDPQSDDSGRALACAKSLANAIDEWNRSRPPAAPLTVAIGIHTGECFCGVVGEKARLEFTVLGDAVNVAARLESLAKYYDEVLIASREALADAHELSDRHAWQRLGVEWLRGRETPIETERTGRRAEPTRHQSSCQWYHR